MSFQCFSRFLSVTAVMVVLAGCKASALDCLTQPASLSGPFASIATGNDGSTRSLVLDAMGQPDSSRATSVAGITHEQLVWHDQTNTYSVQLVAQKAWVKTSAPKPTPKTAKESP